MKAILVLAFLMIGSLSFAQENSRTGVVTTNEMVQRPRAKKYFKNVVHIEMLGRGFLYELGYERMLSQDVSLGIGYSYTTINSKLGFGNTNFKIMSIPLYVNYYVNPGRHNFVLTGGVNIFSFEASARLSDDVQAQLSAASNEVTGVEESFNFGDLELSGNAVIPIPQAGMGYEFRGNSGFMTRLNLYGMYALNTFVPWAGLSVGVAF